MKKNNKGFSLVELIVVIAIMAILAAIAIPTFAHFINKANEASDDELLHNINYIFQAACLENGVDVSEVTAANITYSPNKDTPIVLNSVTVNGDNTLSADIVASFNLHFSDMKNEKFKIIENIYFDSRTHEFVEGTSVYGNLVFDPADIEAIKNSNFGELGADVLLGRIDLATGLLSELAGEGDERVENMLISDPNMAALAKSLGYDSVEDTAFKAEYQQLVAKKMAMIKAENPDITDEEELEYMATIEILSNNAVLVAATQNNYDQQAFIQKIADGAAKAEIKKNLDEDVSLAMSQAAFVYGMYTSYAVEYGIEVKEEEFDVSVVLSAMDEQDFKNYMTEKAEADLAAYNSSMDMISTSTNNKDAVIDVLLNGFNNDGLSSTMNGALN
ncbi:MAG: prepilin-type N-terminal cleavage/methylation domain-containing protein [Clostridia bacterium]|nr:prepilin-type N-terminal cleavage/methylation domain-containing protein [Clostridia bacterium]